MKNLGEMMKQVQEMQTRMQDMQAKLEADDGHGPVGRRAGEGDAQRQGRAAPTSTIDPSLLKAEEKEILEDLHRRRACRCQEPRWSS